MSGPEDAEGMRPVCATAGLWGALLAAQQDLFFRIILFIFLRIFFQLSGKHWSSECISTSCARRQTDLWTATGLREGNKEQQEVSHSDCFFQR
jgi:hypothetical protein